jgi:hemolysin activation/secretion protein
MRQIFLRCHALALGLVLLASVKVAAQDYRRYAPLTVPPLPTTPRIDTPQPAAAEGSDKILVERLDAVIVLDNPKKVQADNAFAEAEGIRFDLADRSSLMYSPGAQQIVNRYIGGPITLRQLNQLSRDLILYYRRNNQPVVDVVIPEQKITQGTVQIVVIESRIGEVRVEGGCYFNPCMLAEQIECTRAGSKVYESALNNDLNWLNRNPFRRVEVDLRPGAQEYTTDVVFQVHDTLPFRSYVGYEDTGVPVLGLERLYAGAIWGNAFGCDGTLSYQYTSDAYFQHLQAHSASYTRAWDRCWAFTAYGALADVTPDIGPPFNQDGRSWQVGGGVTRTLARSTNFLESLYLGVDFKATNNNLEFGGDSVVNGEAELIEFNVGYDRFQRFSRYEYFLFSNDLYIGPDGQFSKHMDDASFSSIRPDTGPGYVYDRMVLERMWLGPYQNLQLLTRFTGQLTSERLLFSEMLGFGGFDSIRGYDMRTFNGDNGYFINLELGPRMWYLGTERCPKDLRAFAFLDLGTGYTLHPQPGELEQEDFMGTGVGLRYSYGNRLTFRFDYGHACKDVVGLRTHDRVHIGAVYLFGPGRP